MTETVTSEAEAKRTGWHVCTITDPLGAKITAKSRTSIVKAVKNARRRYRWFVFCRQVQNYGEQDPRFHSPAMKAYRRRDRKSHGA